MGNHPMQSIINQFLILTIGFALLCPVFVTAKGDVTTLYYVSEYPTPTSDDIAAASTITPAPNTASVPDGGALISISVEQWKGTTFASAISSGVYEVKGIFSEIIEHFILPSTTIGTTVFGMPVTVSFQLEENESNYFVFISPTSSYFPNTPSTLAGGSSYQPDVTSTFEELTYCKLDRENQTGECVKEDLVHLLGTITVTHTSTRTYTSTRTHTSTRTYTSTRTHTSTGTGTLTGQSESNGTTMTTTMTEKMVVETGLSVSTTTYKGTLVPLATVTLHNGAGNGQGQNKTGESFASVGGWCVVMIALALEAVGLGFF